MKRIDLMDTLGQPLKCRVLHYNFSPKGGLEGLIVEAGGQTAQVVCPPYLAPGLAAAVAEGAAVELAVEPAGPSDKGPAAHPVFDLLDLPATGDDAEGDAADAGTVTRLNYARHGAPNGVVLDTGDFVHLKPDGFRQLGLQVGDRVAFEGDSKAMTLGGRVIEATTVNGVAVRRKPKHH